MPQFQRGRCRRHGPERPCTCAMGNLYRFIEPVLLYLLHVRGESHGYELALAAAQHQLTDSEVDRGAVYRTLRMLEENGHVISEWTFGGSGPARRVYRLTESGQAHFKEWLEVLTKLSMSLQRFLDEARVENVQPSGQSA